MYSPPIATSSHTGRTNGPGPLRKPALLLARFYFYDASPIFIENFAATVGAADFHFRLFRFYFFSTIKTDIVHSLDRRIRFSGKFNLAFGAVPYSHRQAFDGRLVAIRTFLLGSLHHFYLGKFSPQGSAVTSAEAFG